MSTLRMYTFRASEGLSAELPEEAFDAMLVKLMTDFPGTTFMSVQGTAVFVYEPKGTLGTVLVIPFEEPNVTN